MQPITISSSKTTLDSQPIIPDNRYKQLITNTLSQIPKEEQSQRLGNAVRSLYTGLPEGPFYSTVLTQLAESAGIIPKNPILKAIEQMARSIRKRCILYASEHIQQFSDSQSRAEYLEAISMTTSKELIPTLTRALAISNSHLSEKPKHIRWFFYKVMMSLQDEEMTRDSAAKIAHHLNHFGPYYKRHTALAFSIIKLISKPTLSEVLLILECIPKEVLEQDELITLTKRYFHKKLSTTFAIIRSLGPRPRGTELVAALSALSNISQVHFMETVNKVIDKHSLTFQTSTSLMQFINYLTIIPNELHDSYVENHHAKACEIESDITRQLYVSCLKHLLKLDSSITDFFKKEINFDFHVSIHCSFAFEKIIASMKPHHITTSLLKHLFLLIEKLVGYKKILLEDQLGTFLWVTPKHLVEEQILFLYNNLDTLKKVDAHVEENILYLALLLPSELRQVMTTALNESNSFTIPPEWKERVHEWCSIQLDRCIPNRMEAAFFSKLITDYRQEIQLEEEAELLQNAIYITFISEEDSSSKNPYTIFEQIQLPREPISSCNIALPREKINDQWATINIETIRGRSSRANLTVGDLPKNITYDQLAHLFDQLQQKPQAQTEIQNSYGQTFEEIKGYLLNNLFVKSIFSLVVTPNQTIDYSIGYFFAILEAIFKLEDTPITNSHLNVREQTLLNFCVSLGEMCSTGNAEQFSIFYHRIKEDHPDTPDLFFENYAADDGLDHTKVNQVIDSTIQSTLNTAFGFDTLLRRFYADSDQSAHSITYLKNRLYAEVGFNYKPTFDPHTNLLSNQLVNASTERLLNEFFKHFLPSLLINETERHITQMIQTNRISYMQLTDYIESNSKQLNLNWQSTSFKFNDAMEPQGITENGAIRLLTCAKVITLKPILKRGRNSIS